MELNYIDDKDSTINIIFGLYKYIFKDFKYNNIQLKGGWYLNSNKEIDEIKDVIQQYKPKVVNLIGTSKSCTGVFIYADELSRYFPGIFFNSFAFSPYTTLDKNFYVENNLLNNLPPSLEQTWVSKAHDESYLQQTNLNNLIKNKNLHTYLLYPSLTSGLESKLVDYVQSSDNVTKIGVFSKFHNILFIFWNKITPDLEIELFEDTVKKIPKDGFMYLNAIQEYQQYNFHIYNLLYNTEKFILEFENFNNKYKESNENYFIKSKGSSK